MPFCTPDSTLPVFQTSPNQASALARVDETRISYADCSAVLTCQPNRGVTSRSGGSGRPLTLKWLGGAMDEPPDDPAVAVPAPDAPPLEALAPAQPDAEV